MNVYTCNTTKTSQTLEAAATCKGVVWYFCPSSSLKRYNGNNTDGHLTAMTLSWGWNIHIEGL